jgi:flagellar basal-body rod protein FlgF
MQSGVYVGISGQIAMLNRLETIAHNVANASTAGFRAEEVKFSQALSNVSRDPVAFATSGQTYLSRESGALVRTDNQFDVAVKGDVWMSTEINGQQVYTRDGRMRMTDNGDLQTLNGYPVLDAGGAPITINPKGGTPQISRDGTISQDGRQFGAIGLFRIPEEAKLTRAANSGVIPDRPAEPALDFSNVGVLQGYVERANVNPVAEMTRLISVHRAFDAITHSIDTTEKTMKEAIKALAGT